MSASQNNSVSKYNKTRMRIGESICLFLNNFFPKKKVEGRESPQAYSEAQYKWARKSLALYDGYIDLQNKIVLDAGCGPGGKTVYFSEQGCKEVFGVDIDENRIEYAKDFATMKSATGIKFIVGNLANLPFEAESFDFIFLNDVVEHLERPILESALAECKRVIKANGKICMEFPPWTSYDAAHLYDFIYIPWCQVFFSDKTLINVMRRIAKVPPTVGKLSHEEHFLELNRITIKEAKQLFRKLQFKIIYFDLNTLFRVRFLKYIPFFNKYLTRRVVAVLSK
ncbi:MAG: class I SAM-dependent methyltransferase [Chitinophagales bacterium]